MNLWGLVVAWLAADVLLLGFLALSARRRN